MKKMYLKSHPHFNFIGRYEFENKQLFVLVWRLVMVNEDVGGKDREQRMSKFLVEVTNAYCVSFNLPLPKMAYVDRLASIRRNAEAKFHLPAGGAKGRTGSNARVTSSSPI